MSIKKDIKSLLGLSKEDKVYVSKSLFYGSVGGWKVYRGCEVYCYSKDICFGYGFNKNNEEVLVGGGIGSKENILRKLNISEEIFNEFKELIKTNFNIN